MMSRCVLPELETLDLAASGQGQRVMENYFRGDHEVWQLLSRVLS